MLRSLLLSILNYYNILSNFDLSIDFSFQFHVSKFHLFDANFITIVLTLSVPNLAKSKFRTNFILFEILVVNSKVRVTLQNSIKHFDSERAN